MPIWWKKLSKEKVEFTLTKKARTIGCDRGESQLRKASKNKEKKNGEKKQQKSQKSLRKVIVSCSYRYSLTVSVQSSPNFGISTCKPNRKKRNILVIIR